MAEEYLGIREFDGFASAIRLEVRQVADQVTQVSSKIDTLVTGRIEEARVMGEITGAIKSINERLERIEKETDSNRKQIDELWESDDNKSQGKLKWWGQMALLILSTIFGGWVAKNWK